MDSKLFHNRETIRSVQEPQEDVTAAFYHHLQQLKLPGNIDLRN